MDVKTLKQARYELTSLEGRVKSLEARLASAETAHEKAKAAAQEWEEKYFTVIDRADVQHAYDAMFDALADYQAYGWPDRLDAALQLVR